MHALDRCVNGCIGFECMRWIGVLMHALDLDVLNACICFRCVEKEGGEGELALLEHSLHFEGMRTWVEQCLVQAFKEECVRH
eukprot:1157746-Pelagomonas_calceolata.AAC.7